MGGVIGLGFGVGVVLVIAGLTAPPTRSPRPPSSWVVELLEAAGLAGLRPRVLVSAAIGTGLVVAIAVQALTRTPPVAVTFGLFGGYLPFALVNARVRRRRREFAEVWPEAVDHLVSGVRAGLGLAEALAGLATRGPEPLRPAFARFAVDYQASGRLTDSLERLKSHLADPVGDRVVEALRIAREVGGGDLGRLLRNLAQLLREDARTRGELESRQASTINGARLAVAAPWLVLLMLSFQREVIQRYATPAGALVLGAGGCSCVVAYRAMIRIGRLPRERRVLR